MPMPIGLEPGSGGGVVTVSGNPADKSLAGDAKCRCLDCAEDGIGP